MNRTIFHRQYNITLLIHQATHLTVICIYYTVLTVKYITLHIVDIRHLLVDDHLSCCVNELDVAIFLYTGQSVREYPGMTILWFNYNLTRVLTEISSFLSITEADE